MKLEIFQNNEYPKQNPEDKEHSIDVITVNDSGLMNIGYYNFKLRKWRFHTDTLVDPYEDGLENFVWMYRPKELTTKL